MSNNRNSFLGLILGTVIVGMVGMSFAAVPLYRIFCAVTGYGGTPNITLQDTAAVSTETIHVRFNATVNPGLPWNFAPDRSEIVTHLGEQQLAFFNGRNNAAHTVTAQATYNVTPEKVGQYFHKIACFCFTQQTLVANEHMEFPVTFWVDPAIRTDPNTADVTTITLSYTIFRAQPDASGKTAQAGTRTVE